MVERSNAMAENLSASELDAEIAIVRDNLRDLVEQAAARSGAADEDLAASRIAEEEDRLASLIARRDALGKPSRS
jgi:hypothetical protein